MATRHILHRERQEWRRQHGLAVVICTHLRFLCPLVIVIILAGFVMIAPGMLVVALANFIGHIAKAVLRIYVTHETLLLATMWAGELLLTLTRQLFVL